MYLQDFFITVPYSGFFFVSVFLYVVSFVGVAVKRQSIIALLLSLELMLLSSFLLFLFTAFYLVVPVGFCGAILILSMAGAESAIGLGLLVAYYQTRSTIDTKSLAILRG